MVSRVEIARELSRCERRRTGRKVGRSLLNLFAAVLVVLTWEFSQFVAGAEVNPLAIQQAMSSGREERAMIMARLLTLERRVSVKAKEGRAIVDGCVRTVSLQSVENESG